MYLVTYICAILLNLAVGLGQSDSSEFAEKNKTAPDSLMNFENDAKINGGIEKKKEVILRGRHFNESMEKVQLMSNGVVTKSAFIPLSANGSSLIYPDNDNHSSVNKSMESLQNSKSLKSTEPIVLKQHPENLNNTVVIRNGKKYKLVKIKKTSKNIQESDFPKNYLEKRGFNFLPNLLSLLPVKWLTKPGEQEHWETKNGTRASEVRTTNESLWSKLEPIRQTEHQEEALRLGVQSSEKIKKLLNLFTIVKFDKGECYADGMKGICLHQSECEKKGGKFTGSCAKELGVCCYNEKTCGGQTKENTTYFVNEGFPEPTNDAPKVCTLTLDKSDPDVKQLRLDFINFQLREPLNGTCFHDRLAVTGQDTNSAVPEICGKNTGQHIYVDVEDSNGPISINVITVGEYFPRHFQIKITQLRKSEDLAPKNCLQYYTEPTGVVQTFNYVHEINENEEIVTGYFNNLNYAICIKKAKGFCSISYENEEIEGAPQPTFQLVNVDSDGEKLLPPHQAGAETFDCPDDYIVLNGVRLCGEKLNDASIEIDFTKNYPVTDTTNGPFLLSVKTDATVSGRGFYLKYTQNPCLL